MAAGDEQPSGRVSTPIRVRSTELPPTSVGAAIDALEPVEAVWTGPGETALVAGGATERIVASGSDRFRNVRQEAASLFERLRPRDVPSAARPRLLGGFSFFEARTLDSPWGSFPPAMFVLPRWQVSIDDESAWLTVTGPSGGPDDTTMDEMVERIGATAADGPSRPSPPGVSGTRPRVAAATWRTHVEEIVETIASGRLEKAVLAQALELTLERPFELRPVFEALTQTYPDCYTFAFSPGGLKRGVESSVFFGASPERAVSKTDETVTTDAIAGTVPVGEDDTQREELSEVLLTDPKMHEEHGVVVDHIRNRLAVVADDVSVTDREVRRLETVQHLQSVLTAHVDGSITVLDVLERLHPTPAVGGVPPAVAIETIGRLEPLDRGWYAAPVGWFDAAGNGTFAVGIRSAVASGTRATLFAGNGIVRDSDPEAEFDEVRLKFRPVLNHLQ